MPWLPRVASPDETRTTIRGIRSMTSFQRVVLAAPVAGMLAAFGWVAVLPLAGCSRSAGPLAPSSHYGAEPAQTIATDADYEPHTIVWWAFDPDDEHDVHRDFGLTPLEW